MNPYVGILAVLLGALVATLNGRLVSVGLADIRGAMGAGVDEASWLPTALNMGTMFIGVFAVFLGSVYGIRKVLLASGVLFTLVSVLLAYTEWLPAALLLQLVAGIASGAFYPLTLTFVLRNLPPKLVIFGIAAYALDIIATSNLAALIEGWFVNHLSWRWIFFTPALATPVVLLCVYFGIPKQLDDSREEKPSWRGFLYMSLGLALVYGALDQGERLDWLNSGIVCGMLASGALLMTAAIVRRWRQPHPMVNLPLLNSRSVAILGSGVFLIRLSLLAPLMVIPAFLAVLGGYKPLETGKALAWIAAPQFVLVWVFAIVAVFVPPRLVMAGGYTLIAFACAMAARVDSTWSGDSFFVAELVMAVGIAAAFVGLIVSLVVLAFEMGAVASVTSAATFSGCMHTIRLLGGQIGASLLAHFITTREHFHSNVLGQFVDAGSWLTVERLAVLSSSSHAVLLTGAQVRAQAYTLAYADAFRLIAYSVAAYLVILAFLPPSKIVLRKMRKAQ